MWISGFTRFFAPPRGFSLSPRPADFYPCPSPPRPTEKCFAPHIPGIQPAQYASRYPPASAALRPRLRPCRLKPPSAPARSCQGCTCWTLIVSKLSGSLPSCSPASSASPFLSPPHPCPPPMWSGTTLSSPLTKRNMQLPMHGHLNHLLVTTNEAKQCNCRCIGTAWASEILNHTEHHQQQQIELIRRDISDNLPVWFGIIAK